MFIFDSKKFREERIKGGWTYGDLAKELQKYIPKAAKSIIHNWEKGSIPSTIYLMAICEIMGKKPEDFMYRVEGKKADKIQKIRDNFLLVRKGKKKKP